MVLAAAILLTLLVATPGATALADGDRTGGPAIDGDRDFWAFRPVRSLPLPAVRRPELVAGAIDALIVARLAERGLEPAPPADRRELARRLHFDLTGLPPTPEELDDFLADPAPDAVDRLIDRLLASPQYGVRWGRHWLDVVRFAQTNGYERDDEKPFAWRYRDYVIDGFNEDRPYDRFVREQLAGDELDEYSRDAIIATGFYRLGVWDDEPDDGLTAEYDGLDDIARAIGTTFLGLTVGCARCHDHMFDPIPQTEYYGFLSFFHNLRPYDKPRYTLDSPTYAPLASPAELGAWRADRDRSIGELEARREAAGSDDEKKKLAAEIDRLRKSQPPFEWALAATERGSEASPVHVLLRGNARDRGAEVAPSFLTALGQHATDRSTDAGPFATRSSSGRRRVLAEWIASSENPLTPRVMANRVWQHLFGRGVVPTPNDFGRAGVPPTHPELLDHLAAELVRGGMSVKLLMRRILMSNAYRMASTPTGAARARAESVDPGNDLFSRQNIRRLEAEAIRDAVLAVGGALDLRLGGRGFFPRLSGEVVAGASRPGRGWGRSSAADRSRRSAYIFVKRTMRVPLMEAFDYVNTDQPLGARPVTTVAPQALMLLNSEFMQEQAARFAGRVLREAGVDREAQVDRAWKLALGREPSPRELRIALDSMQRHEAAVRSREPRLDFEPRAPSALENDYMNRLPPDGFLSCPEGWTVGRGRWVDRTEGISWVEPARGPHALWQGEPFADGVIETRLLLHRGIDRAGLIVRAQPRGTEHTGYQASFEPERGTVAIERHGDDLVELGRAPCVLRPGEWHRVVVECAGPRIAVRVDGEQILEVIDPEPITTPGRVGVRAWRAPVSLAGVRLETGGKAVAIRPAVVPAEIAPREALRALCLVIFNLNEFIHVD